MARFDRIRLAEVRRERGLTQADLAALLDVSPSSVSAVENGHTRPWPKFREGASRVLGVAEELLFEELSQ